MKKLGLILFITHYTLFICAAQDIPQGTEQQLENLADAEQAETEDDTYLQQLEQFRKNPVNLNAADASALKELRIINDLQIGNLIAYRKLFGNLLSIYELQAVPSWDIITIRKLLPFVTIGSSLLTKEDLSKRIKEGDHSFLLRVSQVLERSKGFDPAGAGTGYLGSPQRIFFRYRYTYKNILQYGITGDKDAGEQFFKGAQNKGFDFYSFHLFVAKIGKIQALALGDFTVNMGQGLIQWQSLAFKKSSDVMGIKRQSPVLRPYNSAGEFNFHRGAGVTIKRGNIEATAFASLRKISANMVTDTSGSDNVVSSFLMSGYHRTADEIADRKSLRQTTFGGNVTYSGMWRSGRFHVGVNGVYYSFSSPIQKRDEPYNLFALKGDKWYNLSVDYSYSWKNLHFFGEAAADKNFHKAFINGLLLSADPHVDVSFLHRVITKEYQAISGNAFTENTYPVNEMGLYTGIAIRPAVGWRVDIYGDVYRFPWLKYLSDAPGQGKDFLIQITYLPNKQAEIYARYRSETKEGNQQTGPDATAVNYLIQLPKQNLRMQFSHKINAGITIRNRVEMNWYTKKVENSERGFLTFLDIIAKPLLKPWSAILRLQYFETDGYNSRLYAYENDVLYSYSIPVFFDKGYRYYLTYSYDVTKKIAAWFRWGQTIYRDKDRIGSGLDEIGGNKKTELKIQLRLIL